MNTNPHTPVVLGLHQGQPLVIDDAHAPAPPARDRADRHRQDHAFAQSDRQRPRGRPRRRRDRSPGPPGAGGPRRRAERRAHELVYLDPTDLERPIGFNVLDSVHPDKHALVADDIVSAFLHIWGATAVGDRSQQVLRNSIRALMSAPTATLLGIPRLLTDGVYREQIVRRVHDPVVLAYWRQQFASYDDDFRTQIIAPDIEQARCGALGAGAAQHPGPAEEHDRSQEDHGRGTHPHREHEQGSARRKQRASLGRVPDHSLGTGCVRPYECNGAARRSTSTPTSSRITRAPASRAFSRRRATMDWHSPWRTNTSDSSAKSCGRPSSATPRRSWRCASVRRTRRLLADHLGLEAGDRIQRHGHARDPGRHASHETSQLPRLCPRVLVDNAMEGPYEMPSRHRRSPINHRPHRLITNSRVRFGRDRRTVEEKISRFLAH